VTLEVYATVPRITVSKPATGSWWVPKRFAAFPGLEGFGASTTHVRAGATIHWVSNTSGSGAGSLRAAWEATGDRIIAFKTSGVIRLSGPMSLGSGRVYVAGYTAPSPGITVSTTASHTGNQMCTFNNANSFICHMRFRPEHGSTPQQSARPDAFSVFSPAQNMVVYKCSSSWGRDETSSIIGITDGGFVDCIIAEGCQLRRGTLIQAGTLRVSLIRCLYTHSFDRHPSAHGNTRLFIINNVLYNVAANGSEQGFNLRPWVGVFNDNNNNGPLEVAFIGNKEKAGANSHPTAAYYLLASNLKPGTRWYRRNNQLRGGNKPPGFEVQSGAGAVEVTNEADLSFSAPVYTEYSLAALDARLEADVGARPLDRDSHDLRVIDQWKNGTGVQIALPSDVGGLGSLTVNTYDHETDPDYIANVVPNPFAVDGSGYTAFERHFFAVRPSRTWGVPQVQDIELIPDV
jgi:hypothetical protein